MRNTKAILCILALIILLAMFNVFSSDVLLGGSGQCNTPCPENVCSWSPPDALKCKPDAGLRCNPNGC